jgi:hypothetical protein
MPTAEQASKPAAQARDGPHEELPGAEIVGIPRQYGLFPNVVALSPAVDDIALVMAAYRATFAGPFVLTVSDVSGIARRGSGERPYWRGLRVLQAEGLLERRTAPSGRQGPAHVVDDVLTLPDEVGRRYRRVERRWFDGTLSVKALALLLFVRASGDERASGWHVARRFDWSPPTVKTVADELIAAGHIERRGGGRTPIYAQAQSKIRQSKKEQPKKRQSKKVQSKKRQRLHSVDPLHTVSPLHTVCPEHTGAGAHVGSRTDCDAAAVADRTADVLAATVRDLARARREDGRPKGPMPLDREGEPVCISADDRATIEDLGGDIEEVFDRAMAQKAKGRRIGNVVRYMIQIAQNDAKTKLGCELGVVTAIASGNDWARKAAYAEVLKKPPAKAPDGKTPNGAALLAALRR